jgi:GH15 family glucan-1,4-alpha-glucosidase
MKNSLELGLIGNCRIGALIDERGEIVWSCLPRFDGDPVFCSLLNEHPDGEGAGFCVVELLDQVEASQSYLPNTAVLVTRLTDSRGAAIEITDFSPRFHQYGRTFMPMMIIRQIRRASGNPRICVRVRPLCEYGSQTCAMTHGSHHIRYVAPSWIVRLTTDISVTAVLQELPFFLETTATLILGPDETITDAIDDLSRRFLNETINSWRGWVRDLSIPFEWQEEVIRAAITLKLEIARASSREGVLF